MNWKFNNETPIYLQIMEHMKTAIASGELSPGEKVRPVRDLALEAGVNPNTMQKALSELEREGFLVSQRTSGRFVAENNNSSYNLKQELAADMMKTFLESMTKIGFTAEESLEEYTKYVKGK